MRNADSYHWWKNRSLSSELKGTHLQKNEWWTLETEASLWKKRFRTWMTLICLNVGWKNKENDIPQVGWIHGGFHPMGFLSEKKQQLKKTNTTCPNMVICRIDKVSFRGSILFWIHASLRWCSLSQGFKSTPCGDLFARFRKCTTRWAPTSYQWGEITPISMVITPVTHLFLDIFLGVISPHW